MGVLDKLSGRSSTGRRAGVISNVQPGRANRNRADWDRRAASRSRTEPACPPDDGAGFWGERGAAVGLVIEMRWRLRRRLCGWR